jgi:hypothetical protein
MSAAPREPSLAIGVIGGYNVVSPLISPPLVSPPLVSPRMKRWRPAPTRRAAVAVSYSLLSTAQRFRPAVSSQK